MHRVVAARPKSDVAPVQPDDPAAKRAEKVARQQRARDTLVDAHDLMMQRHPAQWMQRQIDRQSDARGALAALRTYRKCSNQFMFDEAARAEAFRGCPADAPLALEIATGSLWRVAREAGTWCSTTDMDEAFACMQATSEEALAALYAPKHGAKFRPIRRAAVALHLWSYHRATYVDLGGLGLCCEDMPDVGTALGGCRELTILRLTNNSLDGRMECILPALVNNYPNLVGVLIDRNPLPVDAVGRANDYLSLILATRLSSCIHAQILQDSVAISEVQMGTGVQAYFRRRHSRDIVPALPRILPDLARITELQLRDITWRWDDLIAVCDALGGRARNLRFLLLDVTSEPLLAADFGADEADARTRALRLRFNGGHQPDITDYGRRVLRKRTTELLSSLSKCALLNVLSLPKLPLYSEGMVAFKQLVEELPDLLNAVYRPMYTCTEDKCREDNSTMYGKVAHVEALMAQRREGLATDGCTRVDVGEVVEGLRDEARRKAWELAHELAVRMGVPEGRLDSPRAKEPPEPGSSASTWASGTALGKVFLGAHAGEAGAQVAGSRWV